MMSDNESSELSSGPATQYTYSETCTSETANTSVFRHKHFMLSEEILGIKGRQLKAEDPVWALCPVPYLVDICIETIANNILEVGVSKVSSSLSEEHWEQVLKLIPLDFSSDELLPILNENVYWERRCRHQWGLCDIHKYNNDWRKMFAERSVEEAIESYIPGLSNPAKLDNVLSVCKDLVISLKINQLQVCYIKKPKKKGKKGVKETLAQPNHTNIGEIFLRFPKLEEISLSIAPRNIGMKFEFKNFLFTLEDSHMLASNMKKMLNLKVFRLCGSYINYILVKELCVAFMDSSLKELDLSFNYLIDKCTKPIGRLIMGSKTLEILVLHHNLIKDEGISLLAAAISENNTLKALDVKVNQIEDKGAVFLAKCLTLNTTLKSLNISANGLGKDSGLEFANLIEASESLVSLNISGNNLGMEAGMRLKEAMEKNTTLKVFDVRLCELGDESEIAIREFVMRNCGDFPRLC